MAKAIEVYPGVIQYEVCSCEECVSKKKATREFYIKFDDLYAKFQLEKKDAPE